MSLKPFGPFPAPMLHVAVREGDVASLAVPVCRKFIPNILHIVHRVADSHQAVIDALLVFVYENEYPGRRRVDELRYLGFIIGVVAWIFWIRVIIGDVGVAVQPRIDGVAA